MNREMVAITRCAGSFAAHVDVTIVRVPDETMATPFELAVELIEYDVAEQR